MPSSYNKGQRIVLSYVRSAGPYGIFEECEQFPIENWCIDSMRKGFLQGSIICGITLTSIFKITRGIL